ncbi:MurR/RpiR family transcriptional regulator [Oceaniglobus trochenteri]|uniref:MurR/RpiR family transcriptional regulator n=1 Tax=Oceaniglobus trochenteri TaxID=2763260 RepID=UPI001CFF7455|nr:MurR/RpiR family transcriptional regulator [Oceaniglobus trochenteri]
MTPDQADARIDIIGRLKARAEHGNAAEVRLIDAIMGDLQFATHATAGALAAKAGVSEPTVSRLSRALGFSSSREMKAHLAQALAITGAYLRPAESPPAGAATTLTTICARAHAALDLISLALAELDIAPLAEKLAHSRQVMSYGTGGSSSMAATELQNRLFRLNLQANAYVDPQLQRMSASLADHRTVIVAFSLSGRVRSVLDAVAIGRQYGATTIAVAPPDTPIAKAADHHLPLVFEEDNNLYKPSSSRYALLACIDVLAMATAEAIGPTALESLRRVRRSLVTTEITDPANPIGD